MFAGESEVLSSEKSQRILLRGNIENYPLVIPATPSYLKL